MMGSWFSSVALSVQGLVEAFSDYMVTNFLLLLLLYLSECRRASNPKYLNDKFLSTKLELPTILNLKTCSL